MDRTDQITLLTQGRSTCKAARRVVHQALLVSATLDGVTLWPATSPRRANVVSGLSDGLWRREVARLRLDVVLGTDLVPTHRCATTPPFGVGVPSVVVAET